MDGQDIFQVAENFMLPGMQGNVEQYVQIFDSCQRMKAVNGQQPGLLQPVVAEQLL